MTSLKRLPYAIFPALLLLGLTQALPQAPQPAPPAKYGVVLRYRINAPRDPHVAQYDALIAHLKKLDFQFVPPVEEHPETDREDRGKNMITGVIAPGNALKLLQNPNVETVLLIPDGVKLPDDDAGRVLVRLELAGGYGVDRQLALANQTRVLLEELGFQELTGYDHRNFTGQPHTRLVGSVPVGKLEALLKDLRAQPAGWLAPRFRFEDLPLPLRNATPIRVVEVLNDSDPPKALPEPEVKDPPALEKISPDLLALVNQKGEEAKQVRIEAILSVTPSGNDSSWRVLLGQAAPSIFIEGRLGPIVTALVNVGQVAGLAMLPEVSALRLPRSGLIAVDPDLKFAGDLEKALSASGVKALHARGKKGQGPRIAIVDSDFQGWEELVKTKQLPANTRYVDLTAQRHADILPDPPPSPKLLGQGLHCARAAAAAAPEAELMLIRIDPTCPYMLREVADYIAGEPLQSDHLLRRRDELNTTLATLKNRLTQLLRERKQVLENFEDELDLERERPIIGVVRAWVFNPREWHRLRMAELERDQQEHRTRELRFQKLERELASLRGIAIVSCSLNWNDGYPLGGASPLSRLFDDMPLLAKVLWFQSAGNTRGQSWTGFFRDDDANGAMEFGVPAPPLPKGRWTQEVNFLAWKPFVGERSHELPEKTRLRVSLQWREPHDPDYFFRAEAPDLYRKPLAGLRVILLRQRDSEGKVVPADVFDVVARSPELPQRLDNQPSFSTYEAAVEFTFDKPGRYAVRVERQLPERWLLAADPSSDRPRIVLLDRLVPTGIRPLGTPVLPAVEHSWEWWPSLFVQALDYPARGQGRPIFLDYSTNAGGIGMIADARAVQSVGAAKFDGAPEPYSAVGPPANLTLIKPNLRVFDELGLANAGKAKAFGADLATPFAAGLAATQLNAGSSVEGLRARLDRLGGGLFRIETGR